MDEYECIYRVDAVKGFLLENKKVFSSKMEMDTRVGLNF